MGEWIRLTRPVSGHCLIPGLPEGEGFTLEVANEAGRLRPFPRAFIAARSPTPGDPPALAGYPVALADDQNGEFGLAPRRGLAVDAAEHRAQCPHLRPREAVAEMLEQL